MKEPIFVGAKTFVDAHFIVTWFTVFRMDIRSILRAESIWFADLSRYSATWTGVIFLFRIRLESGRDYKTKMMIPEHLRLGKHVLE